MTVMQGGQQAIEAASLSQTQQQSTRHQRVQMRKEGGGGGGRRDDGPNVPGPPAGGDLNEFLAFVHALLTDWNVRVQSSSDVYDDIDADDREQLRTGWKDFQSQWELMGEGLRTAVAGLEKDDLARRGLVGSAYLMKLHFVKKAREKLELAYAEVLDKLKIRKLWHKLFTATDVILDSAAAALVLAPGAGAIVSGLKELKETAMGVSDVVE